MARFHNRVFVFQEVVVVPKPNRALQEMGPASLRPGDIVQWHDREGRFRVGRVDKVGSKWILVWTPGVGVKKFSSGQLRVLNS
jgi:hypothetical protein